MIKKLLRIGSNLFSFKVYLCLTKSDEFQCDPRTSIQSQLNKGISKFKFQKYYQSSWNVSRRNFDVVQRVHFGVISLHGGSREIHHSKFQILEPPNLDYQAQNDQKQTIFKDLLDQPDVFEFWTTILVNLINFGKLIFCF